MSTKVPSEDVYESPWITITSYGHGKVFGITTKGSLTEFRVNADTLVELGIAIRGIDIPEQVNSNVDEDPTQYADLNICTTCGHNVRSIDHYKEC